jgi:hypothetical protein
MGKVCSLVKDHRPGTCFPAEGDLDSLHFGLGDRTISVARVARFWAGEQPLVSRSKNGSARGPVGPNEVRPGIP